MKYKLKCPFCGYEVCKELEGKVLKTFLCPKCEGFMVILADKFNPNKEDMKWKKSMNLQEK